MRCNISDPVLNETETCTPAKIVCNTNRRKDHPYKGQVYLDKTKTDTPTDGVVKVYLYNEWYPVCRNAAFTKTVSDSICRQYGYTGSQNNWASESSGSPSKMCVIATEYTCTNETGSFECFTHCMIPNKYKLDSYEEHVALICSFNVTKKYLRSGSQAQCALPLNETSHLCPTCKNKSAHDRIIIWLLVGFLLCTISILALFIITLLFCYRKTIKRECCRCCRKIANKMQKIKDDDDSEQNDRTPLNDYQNRRNSLN
ncbi:PREDICTED: uncharacterized protein LOC109590405 isoform X1 [Amphimedon queenslandica]|nr:PREDICTED: uncharacterized protein LOC109590405 isoform X1 [Amphimedon queenslandica]|eukprot:XP_019861888.1 PREDICTED: uncharacterized protein LOC109590405 isoform X1 [Amphimedon queenslandica]